VGTVFEYFSIVSRKASRGFPFTFVFCLLLAMGSAARAERCAVCGQEITGDTIYIVTDKVLNEKKHICYDCSVLPDSCFVCGMPLKDDFVKLPDGRTLCARDAKNSVLDADEAKRICEEVRADLDRLFSRFTAFPTNVEVKVVDRVNLLALFKIPGNDFECPDVLGYFRPKTNHNEVQYQISLMSALPRGELKATCAHELAHAWTTANVSAAREETLSADAKEGFCELVSYMLMDSEEDEGQKKEILLNQYTRGQIDLFIEAEKTHGFNSVLDWMKWGTDSELDSDVPNRINVVEMPPPKPAPALNTLPYTTKSILVPDSLVLKGISGAKNHALAIINDQSLAAGESARVRVAKTNVLVRCLEIRDDSVRIEIVGSGEEQKLSLQKPKP
jgi:hypothetical protein